ncbi:hypothetical protein [Streptomyces sp. CB00455]|uniref:hypothetical protein n=1 Tax=Streptomyces sp. CB00455 TaxID=1703927 RepID=UPI00130166BA|nr:hypothetical protein [Streptomyces sp. CB00455]
MKERDDTFMVCKECDTVWEDGDPVAKAPYVILEEYMARFGKSQLWTNLEQLEG